MDERFYLPIIYLRGFTFGSKGTEETVGDPFYGFNTGSTQIRQDATGQTQFFVFESPVIRLLTEHGYRDAYHAGVQAFVSEPVPEDLSPEQVALRRRDDAGQEGRGNGDDDATTLVREVTVVTQQVGGRDGRAADGERVNWRSLWIYRYYDQASRTFVDSPGRRQEIEESAIGLRDLIVLVRQQTGAPRVILVGHSTGGLIIRCLLQRTYASFREDPRDFVDKVFTYATPHGGIHFSRGGGLLERARDVVGGIWDQSNFDDFGPRRMFEFLTPDGQGRPTDDWDPRRMVGLFPVERVFCLVGTNPEDYGLPRVAVGSRSDGLVQIESAYVKGAPRAYVHRSHSGRYGIINSEEGFHNLERFLFGDLQVQVELDRLDRLRPPRDQLDLVRGKDVAHLVDATVSIRGLPTLMHDQQLRHHSAVPLELEKLEQGEPIPLFRAFLMRNRAPEGQPARYAVRLRLHRIDVINGRQQLSEHLEQVGEWQDTLICDLGDDNSLWTMWVSDHPDWRHRRGELALPREGDGHPVFEIRLSSSGRRVLGDAALVRLLVQPWNYWFEDPRTEPVERPALTRLNEANRPSSVDRFGGAGPSSETQMRVGERRNVVIEARRHWNNTGISLVRGGVYEFVASGKWRDWAVETDADGYPSRGLIQRMSERLRRYPQAQWFTLIGATSRRGGHRFSIGRRHVCEMPSDGVLFCFANDLWLAYANNSGRIDLTITRMR